jgi:Cu-Zn family superoxide dismutase
MAVSVMTGGCGSKQTSSRVEPGAQPLAVNVDFINSQGKKAGTAMLTQTDGGVKVSVRVTGLKPGNHGIHFHETGACQVPDFESAGGHFNPFSKHHGLENPQGPHAGDLPNLQVGADGSGTTEFVTKLVTLVKDQPNSLLKAGGTALVIHADPDDQKSDPSGNSGSRIACGVIK